MTHYYEKNIVEIKNEYNTYLTDLLTPLIYEGIQSMYNSALENSDKFDLLQKANPTTKNPGVIKIFKKFLQGIPTLSANSIDIEVKRIKELSRCSEFFDDLVRAVVKSYIILLTYNATGKTCKLVLEKYHEKINVNDFVHKCYIECSVIFYNNPELFWTEHNKETLQACKTISFKYIKQSITDSIHKMLPIRQILQEYLNNDYIVEEKKEDTVKESNKQNSDKELKSEKKEQSLEQKVSEFHPPKQENGFSILEADEQAKIHDSIGKHKQGVLETSDVISDNEINMFEKNEMEKEIKDKLAQIVVDDKQSERNVAPINDMKILEQNQLNIPPSLQNVIVEGNRGIIGGEVVDDGINHDGINHDVINNDNNDVINHDDINDDTMDNGVLNHNEIDEYFEKYWNNT